MQKKKTAIVTARMMPEVKRQLQARARDANMTLTNYLIICGLGQEITRVEGLDAVEGLFLGRGGVLIGQQYPPGHLGVICRLDTEGAETVGTNQFGKLRVAFRAAEIPGQELPFIGQNRLVDEPNQPIEIHDILFNGRPGEQQLEGTPGDALEGFRLLIALLVDG